MEVWVENESSMTYQPIGVRKYFGFAVQQALIKSNWKKPEKKVAQPCPVITILIERLSFAFPRMIFVSFLFSQ